jgi:hypothetical protein
VLSKNGGAPEGLPHSIIVTPEGVEGEVPAPIAAAPGGSSNGAGATVGAPNAPAAEAASPNGAGHDTKSGRGSQRAAKAAGQRRGNHARPAKRATRRKAGNR